MDDGTGAPVGRGDPGRDPIEKTTKGSSPQGRSSSDGILARGDGDRSITIGGDLTGIASTGDFAFNILIPANGKPELRSVMGLAVQPVPPLPQVGGPEPVGRDAVLDLVAAELAAGRGVQLYGAAGVGKKAVMRAVLGRLATAGGRGYVFLPQDGEPQSLESLYRRMAGVLFGEVFIRVDEAMLRVAAAEAEAIVAIADCELVAADLTRLVESFPRCIFLITSKFPTLHRLGSAYEIAPLTQESAFSLVSQELESGPEGLEHVQFEQAYRLAEGRTQRLLQYAAYLKSLRTSPGGPGYADSAEVTPHAQAVLLASRLSEPARRVLIALATFGVGLASEYFAAVAGLELVGDAAAELIASRLVTVEGDVYRVTDDAASAVSSQQWQPIDLQVIAAGLLALLADRAPHAPAPELLLAVAGGLAKAGQYDRALSLLKVAAPLAIREARVGTWTRLVAQGANASRLAGRPQDLSYFLTERHNRDLLRGDRAAAAAALVALAALLDRDHPLGRVEPSRRPRRLARRVRRALPASPIAASLIIATVVAIVAVVAVAVGAARTTTTHSEVSANNQDRANVTGSGKASSSAGPVVTRTPSLLTGTQLASALLPLNYFPKGYSLANGSQSDSGSSFYTVPANVDLGAVYCKHDQTPSDYGEVAYASAEYFGTDLRHQPSVFETIDEFPTKEAASGYVEKIRSIANTCPAISSPYLNQSSVLSMDVVNGNTTLVVGNDQYGTPPGHSKYKMRADRISYIASGRFVFYIWREISDFFTYDSSAWQLIDPDAMAAQMSSNIKALG